MKPKPHHFRGIVSAVLIGGAVGAGLIGLPGDATAQFGQTSPFTIELNRVFNFNGDKVFYAKAPDCKEWADAMQFFDTARSQGQQITIVKGKTKIESFVEHAYHERIGPNQYFDLETIFAEKIDADNFRIYTANEPKQVVCGFTVQAYLNKIWFEAGLQGKDVAFEARVPSVLDPLRVAYWMESYNLVRNSLQQRGYSVFAVPDPVIERCKPSLERLCETYPEAFCDREDLGGISCTFVFRRNGTKEIIGVDASVAGLTEYTARIEVMGLRELGVDP